LGWVAAGFGAFRFGGAGCFFLAGVFFGMAPIEKGGEDGAAPGATEGGAGCGA
jgi:hypothetical protein